MKVSLTKNIISMVLCVALLLTCLSGCSIFDCGIFDKGDQPMDLDGFLAKMQKESEEIEKIEFSILYQDLHYELKESDKYINDNWTDSALGVIVAFDYELVTHEYWYKNCSNKDHDTINNAFYNRYKNVMSKGFKYSSKNYAITFIYNTENSLSDALTDFYADYEIFKRWANLDYVTLIGIQYSFSMPGSYFDNVYYPDSRKERSL